MDRPVGDEVDAKADVPGGSLARESDQAWKRVRHGLPVVILLAAVVGHAVLRMTRPLPTAAETQERAWNVEVQTIHPETLTPTLTLYGRVGSPRLTELSAPILADAEAVSARAGSSVEEAAVLVRLDDREGALALAAQQAELAEIEA